MRERQEEELDQRKDTERRKRGERPEKSKQQHEPGDKISLLEETQLLID